jgi:hypothetical protein
MLPGGRLRRGLDKLLGFLLGVVLSLVSLMICMPLGGVLRISKPWTFSALYGLVLLAVGAIDVGKPRSEVAQGILIAASVAFLMNEMFGILAK